MPPKRPRRDLPPRKFGRRSPGAARTHPLLLRANQLFSNGNYLEAAGLYEKMAIGAFERKMPRAPILFLQAGKALFVADRVNHGMQLVQRGLGLLADQKRWGEMYQFGGRSVDVLSELGYTDQANALQDWLKSRLPEDKEPAAAKEAPLRIFATVCPDCGARLHPHEMQLIDETTTACSFCGSLIRTG